MKALIVTKKRLTDCLPPFPRPAAKRRGTFRAFLVWFLAGLIAAPAPCWGAGLCEKVTNPLHTVAVLTTEIRAADDKTLHDFNGKAEKLWLATYQTQWVKSKMDDALSRCVSTAFVRIWYDRPITDRGLITVGTDASGKFLGDVVNEAQKRFHNEYALFLKATEESFAKGMEKLAEEYVKALLDNRKQLADLAGIEEIIHFAPLPPHVDIHAPAGGSPPVNIRELKPLLAGTMVLALRKALGKKVFQNLLVRMGGAAAKKLIFVVKGPVGWVIGVVLLLWDGWGIGRDIWNFPEQTKQSISQGMSNQFVQAVPRLAWEGDAELSTKDSLKTAVREQLEKLQDAVSGGLDAVIADFCACPAYSRLAQGLDKEGQTQLVTRLFRLKSETVSVCGLAERLGETLKTVGPPQLACIEDGIKRHGLDSVSEWVKPLPPERVCPILELPAEYLKDLKPDREALRRLYWALDLPPDRRTTGLNMARDYKMCLDRFMKHPPQEQATLLNGRTAKEVCKEPPPPPCIVSIWDWMSSDGPPPSNACIKKAFKWTGAFILAAIIFLLLRKLGLFKLLGWLTKKPNQESQRSSAVDGNHDANG